MRDPYRIFVNQGGKFELVDMRTNPDLSDYIAETTSSWKKVITAGQRGYYSTSYNFTRGTYLLSYPKGPCIAVNPTKGDYIPPGYTSVSRDLDSLFNGYDAYKIVARSKLKPLHGDLLVNYMLEASTRTAYLYRNQVLKTAVPGWALVNGGNNYCSYIDLSEGPTCRYSDDNVIMTQSIDSSVWDGRTRLRIRLNSDEGGETPISRSVLINDMPMIRDGDIFTWERDESPEGDVQISVAIGSDRPLSDIEVLND